MTAEPSRRLRDRLLALLAEDSRNTRRIVARLDAIAEDEGETAHAALLRILTRLDFDESAARKHWEAIVDNHDELACRLERTVGVRVAVLDYFVNLNRSMIEPALIELDMLDAEPSTAAVDPLTGLAPAARFRKAVHDELKRARRYGHPSTVVLIDLDDFAEMNRSFGPPVGDRVLKDIARLLLNISRDIDLRARPGEDEFALLLPETGREGAWLLADRFRGEVERTVSRMRSDGRALSLTLSAGIATYPEDATTSDDLLARAATALYEAKASGKNCVECFREERRRFLRFELEPGRFEVEVVGQASRGRPRNLSRNGILFASPQRLDLGECVEIRLAADNDERSAGVRGQVVRIEELPEPVRSDPRIAPDHYEIGVAFEQEAMDPTRDPLEFLRQSGRASLQPIT